MPLVRQRRQYKLQGASVSRRTGPARSTAFARGAYYDQNERNTGNGKGRLAAECSKDHLLQLAPDIRRGHYPAGDVHLECACRIFRRLRHRYALGGHAHLIVTKRLRVGKAASLLVAACVFLLVGTGCAAGGGGGGDSSQSQTSSRNSTSKSISDLGEVGRVYVTTVKHFPKSLPLPPGQSFPTEAPSTWNPKVITESSYGENIAYFYWRCSWSDNFLKAYAASDEAGQSAALDQLEKWTKTSFFREHVVEDPNAGWEQLLIAPARLGDVTMMRNFDTSDCTYYRQVNPPAGRSSGHS